MKPYDLEIDIEFETEVHSEHKTVNRSKFKYKGDKKVEL